MSMSSDGPASSPRPGLGWIAGSLAVLLLVWPPVLLVALFVGPGKHGGWSVTFDPETTTSLMLNPTATWIICGLAGLVSLYSGWLIVRGRRRRDLWHAVFAFWLAIPGQAVALALLHWFMLWRKDVGIYDFWLRLQGIGEALLVAAIATAYLLLSRRMKARFPAAPIDVADVF